MGKGDGYSIGKSVEKQGSYVVKMYKMFGHSSIHCGIRCCKKDLFVKLVQSVLLGDTLNIWANLWDSYCSLLQSAVLSAETLPHSLGCRSRFPLFQTITFSTYVRTDRENDASVGVMF